MLETRATRCVHLVDAITIVIEFRAKQGVVLPGRTQGTTGACSRLAQASKRGSSLPFRHDARAVDALAPWLASDD